MRKKFFQLQGGVLAFVFEGTEEELKAHFEQEKSDAIAFYERAMVQCEENIEKQVRPERYDSMSDAEKAAIDAELASAVAREKLKKDNYAHKVNTAKAMKIQDVEYFAFDAIKIQ